MVPTAYSAVVIPWLSRNRVISFDEIFTCVLSDIAVIRRLRVLCEELFHSKCELAVVSCRELWMSEQTRSHRDYGNQEKCRQETPAEWKRRFHSQCSNARCDFVVFTREHVGRQLSKGAKD